MRILALSCIFALVSSGCVSTNYNLATKQQEYTITSTEKEVNMGMALAKRVNSELTFLPDKEIQERARGIGEKLVAMCDRKELVYTFSVVEDDSVNAFSLPGGYVFINDGLIKKVATDDELAAVIAHEIAHIAARHSVKRYESALGSQLIQTASMAVTKDSRTVNGIEVAAFAARLSYARKDELEADRMAVRYLEAAGFDPNAMLTFLESMEKAEQYKRTYIPSGILKPLYASTHPFVSDRIRAVKEELFGVADYVDYLNTAE
jgi:predicted Zn-dependent protease